LVPRCAEHTGVATWQNSKVIRRIETFFPRLSAWVAVCNHTSAKTFYGVWSVSGDSGLVQCTEEVGRIRDLFGRKVGEELGSLCTPSSLTLSVPSGTRRNFEEFCCNIWGPVNRPRSILLKINHESLTTEKERAVWMKLF